MKKLKLALIISQFLGTAIFTSSVFAEGCIGSGKGGGEGFEFCLSESACSGSSGFWDGSACSAEDSNPPEENKPPIANFSISPSTSGIIPFDISLDASTSSDNDGSINSYQWSSSDGKTASGKTTSFTFNQSGSYEITLIVTDDKGASSSKRQSISVKQAPDDPIPEPCNTGKGDSCDPEPTPPPLPNRPPVANFSISPSTEGVAPFSINLNAAASSDSDGSISSYQWSSSDGKTANGETANFTFNQAGNHNIILTVTDDLDYSSTAEKSILVNSPSTNNTRLINISTRSLVSHGQESQIAGFIIAGTGNKRLLIRVAGSSLQNFGIDTNLDPKIELYKMNADGSSVVIASNDDWKDDSRSGEITDLYKPTNHLDSALLRDLAPGAYTAIATPLGESSDVGLISVDEIATANTTSTANFINISTRSEVSNGENTQIAGFIINGTQSQSILIRAAGKSLQNFGINTNLDPKIELYRINSDAPAIMIESNDDWQNDSRSADISSIYQPTHRHDAALLRDLAPGVYTAIISPANGISGVGLVSVDLIIN